MVVSVFLVIVLQGYWSQANFIGVLALLLDAPNKQRAGMIELFDASLVELEKDREHGGL